METKWKSIVGYEGAYEVSDGGDIRSLSAISRARGEGRTLAKRKITWGYIGASLCKNGVIKQTSVHRLVAQAFIPNPDGLPQVNHKNGIKADNRAENLEWASRRDNIRHSIKLGTWGKKVMGVEMARNILETCKTTALSNTEIGKKFGVSRQAVRGIRSRDKWQFI